MFKSNQNVKVVVEMEAIIPYRKASSFMSAIEELMKDYGYRWIGEGGRDGATYQIHQKEYKKSDL